ncbi:MAG: 2-succinyl-5-enolpyruvyl-6-hydroxy-3-cyclohexene-1-carboxylic-acid synthase [bacterium]|nr:2-succinyl-5-enolpyruvyl-6-hydroxy-3-cyclohexene-1-carboxylic-acid synthase [bacterium]
MRPATGTDERSRAAHLQAQWARLLLGSLADVGVCDVVISPGSRSTPFVLAAAADRRLRCHRFVDERSAAFFALGQGRASGRPSLLLCTSGTAGAHYLPAVIEASASFVPLLVLTADRPLERSACGANQTIDQLKLFGDHVRQFFDLGLADDRPEALRALRRTVAQAVFRTTYPEPGAVHLNARARKPLEPTALDAEPGRRVDRLLAAPIARPSAPERRPQPAELEALAAACAGTPRGLIVCGPAPLDQARCAPLVAELSERTGFPILAEAASQLRFRPRSSPGLFVDAFDLILDVAAFRRLHRPELVIQIGRPATSGAWGRTLAENAGVDHWVISPHGWLDAESTATALCFAELEPTLAGLLERLPKRGPSSAWAGAFRRAEELAWRAAGELLAARGGLSEGVVAREVVAALPAGGLLAVGNSLPIRQLDRYCPGVGVDLGVVCQRGASGIDGLVSGAAGAADASRRPCVALVGDLSLLHDLSGLAAVARLETPFAVVVVNNDGGRIFEQLPLADDAVARPHLDLWLTPQGLDFRGAAAMVGLAYLRVEDRPGLSRALAALGVGEACLIEARVPPHGAAEEIGVLRRRLDDNLNLGDDDPP